MSNGSPGGEVAAFDRGAWRPRPGSDNCIPLRLGRRERAQDLALCCRPDGGARQFPKQLIVLIDDMVRPLPLLEREAMLRQEDRSTSTARTCDTRQGLRRLYYDI